MDLPTAMVGLLNSHSWLLKDQLVHYGCPVPFILSKWEIMVSESLMFMRRIQAC